MALSTRRLCVLLLLLLGLAATFSHVAGAVLQVESAATFPGRRAGPPVAGAYHGSGFTHVPHGYYGSKQISFGVGDYDSAGGRGSVWNVMVAPVLAAAWFA